MSVAVAKRKQYGVRVNGVLVREYFMSKSEAKAWQRKMKLEAEQIKSGTKSEIEAITLEEAAREFLLSRMKRTTYENEAVRFKKYILSRPGLKDRYLHQITKNEWSALFEEDGDLVNKHGLSNATHNRIRAMVHRLYEINIHKKEPARAIKNPITGLERLPESGDAIPFFDTQEKIDKYVKAAYADPFMPSFGLFAMLSLNLGLRQSNVMGIKFGDVDANNSTIWIRLKWIKSLQDFQQGMKGTNEEKLMGMNEALLHAIQEWRKITPHNSDSDYIVQRKDGRHATDRALYDAHVRTMERAKLEYINLHALRHTYATQYLEAGGRLEALKDIMNHSSITVTMRYVRLIKKELKAKADVFQVKAPAVAQVIPMAAPAQGVEAREEQVS